MEAVTGLFELADTEYADFQAKLTPTLKRECFIGVRLPVLRDFAKEFAKTPEAAEFLASLPHKYYDENMLHGVLISKIKSYDECISALDAFLPYVDNWAVCDTMSPKALAKDKSRLLLKIREWVKSDQTYTIRFGMDMLMSHFLDADFKPEYLDIPIVESDEYYVNMMAAWYYATALAKQWDSTITYIEQGRLSAFVHNKTIQKARESFRITKEQKEYLKTLKR